MQHFESEERSFGQRAKGCCALAVALWTCWMAGCGGGSAPAVPTTQPSPQTYMAPTVIDNSTSSNIQLYTFDDTANPSTFAQSTFALNLPAQQGPQVMNAGVTAAGERGFVSLGITTSYAQTSQNIFVPTTYNPPQAGGFAVELAGQTGGLAQLAGHAVRPLVAAQQCPSSKTPQTYLFITTPAPEYVPSPSVQALSHWAPTIETAYGTVDISSSGTNITFDNIHQFTLPSVGGSGTPAKPATSPATGICGQTYMGNTVSVPGNAVTQHPGGDGPGAAAPEASIAIGPSGLLLEDNGNGVGASFIDPATSLNYENVLGAGMGAVGLPKPTSALDPKALVGAQYVGFVYGAGASAGWTSHPASFGFPSVPSNCASVAAATNTLIYGGDYPNDNPTTSAGGFGNCDLALDLGTQDTATSGLFPKATIWLGAGYAGNTTGQTYSFSAVAIAGQLNGKNAIFVLGIDSTQPWAIYLLQSN